MRLIDADALIHELNNSHYPGAPYIDAGISIAIGKVLDAQTIRPEIVRCKDCRHRGEKPISDGRYWCNIHNAFMYYCSDAERRTGE